MPDFFMDGTFVAEGAEQGVWPSKEAVLARAETVWTASGGAPLGGWPVAMRTHDKAAVATLNADHVARLAPMHLALRGLCSEVRPPAFVSAVMNSQPPARNNSPTCPRADPILFLPQLKSPRKPVPVPRLT